MVAVPFCGLDLESTMAQWISTHIYGIEAALRSEVSCWPPDSSDRSLRLRWQAVCCSGR
jgi:hypothetical protein